MTGVITDKCIKCKHMDCVEVCPVDAFYEGANMLVIHPDECVDCGCCIVECPIDAIFFDTDPQAAPWIKLNRTYSKIWPNVTYKNDQTPPDAEQFRAERGKFERFFSPEPGEGDVGPPFQAATLRACRKCDEPGWRGILNRLARLCGLAG